MSDNPASWSQMGLGSSGSTTIAQGKISIVFDPSSKTVLVNTARSIGQQIRREINQGTAGAAQDAGRNLEGLNASLKRTASIMAGVFSAGAVFSVTRGVNQLNQRFRIFVGDAEKANVEMAKLRTFADDMSQPFLSVVESATQLLPALRNTNAELSKAVLVSQKLQIFDPQQGAAGAALALRELFSGDITSLSRRFEIPRDQLRGILDEANGDLNVTLTLLDELLTDMGLTNDALRQFGEADPFSQALQEGKLLLSTVFSPMLTDAVIPLTRELRDAVQFLNEGNSEAVRLAITFAGILTTVQAINKSGLVGAGISNKSLARGFGAAGAFELGIAGSRALAESGIVNNPELENVSQGDARGQLVERLKQASVAAADTIASLSGVFAVGRVTFENAFTRFRLILQGGGQTMEIGFLFIRDKLYDVRDSLIDFVNNFRNTFADMLVLVGEKLDSIPGIDARALIRGGEGLRVDATSGQAERQAADDARSQALRDAADNLARITEQLQNSPLLPSADQAAEIAAQTEAFRKSFVGGVFDLLFDEAEETADAVNEVANAFGNVADAYTEDQLEAFADYNEELGKIQAESHADLLEAEKDYQDQRQQAQDEYNKQLDRDQKAEDLRRSRAEAELARNISDQRVSGAEREAQLVRDSQEKIGKLQSEYHASEVKREEDFNRNRTRRLRDLARGLRDAASRLDASAVLRLLQTNRDRAADEREAFDTQTQERSAEHEARLQQAQTERDEQLQAMRDATDTRISEMQASFKREEDLRAEDRNIRLAQQQEDHEAQLAQLDANYAERRDKIQAQAREESDLLTQQFIATYNEMNEHNGRMIAIQRAGLEGMEQQLFMFVTSWQQRMGQMTPTTAFENTRKTVGRWFAGGTSRVSHTGMFGLERGESVIPAHTAEMMRRSMGGEITPVGLAAAMNGGNAGNRSITIDRITNNFGDIGDYSEQEIIAIFDKRLIEVLREI